MDDIKAFIETASEEDLRNIEGYISLERNRRNSYYTVGRIFQFVTAVSGDEEDYIVLTRKTDSVGRLSTTRVEIMPLRLGYEHDAGIMTFEYDVRSLPQPPRREKNTEEPEVSIELTVDESTKTAGPPAEAA